MANEDLLKIVSKCIACKLNEINSLKDIGNFAFMTAIELNEYAEFMGYKGSMTDLFNFADGMDVSNMNGEFEKKVIDPVKKAQGIYS